MHNKPIYPEGHIVWLDVLRFIAILMVIFCHCTDPFNASPASRANPEYRLWGAVWGAGLRACVPLFVMITGYLLLPVRRETGVFYKKRILRVLYPFLIWSALYNLVPWFIQWVGGSAELVTVFFPYATHPSPFLADAVKNILMIPLTFNGYTTHMWYVYLLIGLYLYLPVFSAWVEKVSDKAKLYFLCVWGVTLFLPYMYQFITPNLFGACAWNAYGMLYYFAGFNGYLLLGHYLGKMEPLSWKKTWMIAIPLFVVGYLVTFNGFCYMIEDPNVSDQGLELFFTYCSINSMMMTLAIFLVVKNVNITYAPVRRALANLTKCGFGIYMAHYLFIGPSYLLTSAVEIPVAWQIPVTGVIVFAAVWGVINLFYRLPGAKYIVG